jgi:hypothetical protein
MGYIILDKEENLYVDCCGGVWSDFLQCYTGHFNDCEKWLIEVESRWIN